MRSAIAIISAVAIAVIAFGSTEAGRSYLWRFRSLLIAVIAVVGGGSVYRRNCGRKDVDAEEQHTTSAVVVDRIVSTPRTSTIDGLKWDASDESWHVYSYRIAQRLLSLPAAQETESSSGGGGGGSGSLTSNYVPSLMTLLPERVRRTSAYHTVSAFLSAQVLSLSGKRHRTVHQLLASVLTPNTLTAVDAFVRSECQLICNRIRDRLKSETAKQNGKPNNRGSLVPSWDIVSEIAEPLPIRAVLKVVFGLDDSVHSQRRWKEWSDHIERWFSCTPVTPRDVIRARFEAVHTAIVECAKYLEPILIQRESKLAARTREYDRAGVTETEPDLVLDKLLRSGLSRLEIVANIQFVVSAGHSTTTSLITTGLHRILHARHHHQQLAYQPVTTTDADSPQPPQTDSKQWLTPEIVRACSPVCLVYRQCTPSEAGGRDIVLSSTAVISGVDTKSESKPTIIRAGDGLVFHIDSINSEPPATSTAAAAGGDEKSASSGGSGGSGGGGGSGMRMTFGYGAHSCIGRSLALVEAEAIVSTVLRLFPSLRLATLYGGVAAVPLVRDPTVASIVTVRVLLVESHCV